MFHDNNNKTIEATKTKLEDINETNDDDDDADISISNNNTATIPLTATTTITNNNNNTDLSTTINLNMQIKNAEEEEKKEEAKESINEKNEQQHHDSNLNIIQTKHKEFQVVIVSDDLLKDNINNKENKQQQQQQDQQLQQQVINNNNNNIEEISNDNEEKLEPLETLPVEEGYATRKMDEYFRQTIAAIKQELTKKFEESHPNDDIDDINNNHHHHHHHHHHYHNDNTIVGDLSEDLSNLNAVCNKDDNVIATNLIQQSSNSNDLSQMKTSLNCVDCFLNGHCALHTNTSMTMTTTPTTANTTPSNLNRNNTSARANRTNARYNNIINWLLIIASILNHVLIDGFIFNYSNLFSHVQNAYSSMSNDENLNGNAHNYFIEPNDTSLYVNSINRTTTSTTKANLPSTATTLMIRTTISPSSFINSSVASSIGNTNKTYFTILYTLPGSFLIGIYLLFTPISLYISKRFGIRVVSIIGSIISALSILAASFMKLNVALFILFYSIFNGVGISLVYIPSVLIVSEWPYRKRLFSNTLVLCGTSIGIAIYPLICEFLLKKFDFFDTMFLLSSIQLNLLVGTLILISYKDYYGNNHAKLNKQSTNGHTNGHMHISSAASHHSHHHHHSSSSHTHHKIKDHHHFNDDESTNSQSIDNFTLKQHWRRFCQTRKSNLKNRKNLFHLIAEEKRKSRALSKGSLEDGFVITTSNNLLAPDDPNVVLLSRRGQSTANGGTSQNGGNGATSTHKPNLLARIAHSLRSLTHHGSSSLHDKHHSHHGAAANNSNSASSHGHHHHHQTPTSTSSHHHSHHSHSHQQTTQFQHRPISEHSDNEKLLSDTSANATTSSTASGSTPPIAVSPPAPAPVVEKTVNLELMNVFIRPVDLMEKIEEKQVLPEEPLQQQQQQKTTDENNNNLFKSPKETNHNLDLFHLHDQDFHDTSSSSGSNSGSDSDEEYSPYMDTALNEENASSFFSSSSAKSSRYMSYRNSLANSVRGSLMECSVQEEEDGENESEFHNANGKNSKSARASHHHHHHHYGSHHRHGYSHHPHHRKISSHHGSNSHHQRLHTTPNTTIIHNNVNNVTNKILYYNERIRKLNTLSIIDTASLLNLPINSKTLYFNLNNSFIKKRKKYNNSNNPANANNNNGSNISNNSKTVNFVNYLRYLFDRNLFLNSLIFLTNLTFSLSILGLITPLFYLIQYLKSRGIDDEYCIYILSTVGLASAIGRIISTVVYKSNTENIKNRTFAYNLSTILIGLLMFASTFCGSLFTFALFAMGYGGLLGFNLCLRSVFLYDMIGLDWNDDSLFSVLTFGQGLALIIGLPAAGLIADIWNNFAYVYYFACVLLLLSGVLTIVGSKLIEFFICTHKSFNKSYLKKRS